MTQIFFDKNNKSFFFNTNETICLNQGLIYKDLYGNLFDTNNVENEPYNCEKKSGNEPDNECVNMYRTTGYSSIFDDPALGELGRITNALQKSTDLSDWNTDVWKDIREEVMQIPSHAKNKDLYKPEYRIKNLIRTHQNRGHYAAGGNGTWENPISVATCGKKCMDSSLKTTTKFLYQEQLGNIYWIDEIRSYIIVEDEIGDPDADKPSHIDIWIGTSIHLPEKNEKCVYDENNITYYHTQFGDKICLGGEIVGKPLSGKEQSYNIFKESINKDHSSNKTNIYKYLYSQFSLMDQMTYPHIDNDETPPKKNPALKIYLANTEKDHNKLTAAGKHPIGTELIEYGYEYGWNTKSENNPNYRPRQHNWGKQCFPSSTAGQPYIPDNEIETYMENKSVDNLYKNNSCFNKRAGYFYCDNCPDKINPKS